MKTDASVKTHERVQLQRKQSRNLERMFAAFGRSRISLKTLVILIVAMAALSGLATLVALLVLVDFNFSRLAALASGTLAISEAQSELSRLQTQLTQHEYAIQCSDVPIDHHLTLPTIDSVCIPCYCRFLFIITSQNVSTITTTSWLSMDYYSFAIQLPPHKNASFLRNAARTACQGMFALEHAQLESHAHRYDSPLSTLKISLTSTAAITGPDDSFKLTVAAGTSSITANTITGAMHGLQLFVCLVRASRSSLEHPRIAIGGFAYEAPVEVRAVRLEAQEPHETWSTWLRKQVCADKTVVLWSVAAARKAGAASVRQAASAAIPMHLRIVPFLETLRKSVISCSYSSSHDDSRRRRFVSAEFY